MKLREHYEVDRITVEAAADSSDFDMVKHIARMADFDGNYFAIMALVYSPTRFQKPSKLSTSQATGNSRVNLHKILLPTFYGDPKQWSNVSDLFSTLVINSDI